MKPDADTNYDRGVEAGIAGVEMWMNPHAHGAGSQQGFSAWLAGWCFGTRVRLAKLAPSASNTEEPAP